MGCILVQSVRFAMATKYYVANAHVNETILLKAANDFEPVNAFHIADAEDGVRDYLQKDASGKLSRKLSYAPIEPGGIMKVPLDYAKIFLANGTVLYATDTPAYAVALIVTSHGFVYSDLLPVDDGEQVDRARFFTDHLIHNNYDPAHVAVVPVTHNGTFNTFKIFGCAPDLTNEASTSC